MTATDDALERGVVVLVATSRDRGETYLDACAWEATVAERDGGAVSSSGRASAAPEAKTMDATERRIFMASRRYERHRECAQSGGLLTRALLNQLESQGAKMDAATWGNLLRRTQRSMQRLPPGTSSSIRVSSTRDVQLEQSRWTFSHQTRNVGVRRGLFVGVNYEDAKEGWRLRRRGQDAMRMRDYLKSYCGYDDDDEMMVLTDDAEVSSRDGAVNRTCTKRAILKACRWLVSEAKEGDALFFYFSGREQVLDDAREKSQEKGQEKTAICATDTPLDPHANRITRRELREVLVDVLPPKVRLTVVLDMYGGGGEHALCELPLSCVNITLPDERDIKQAKNGKKAPALTPLWMLPNGEQVVRDFVTLCETTSVLFDECARSHEIFEKAGPEPARRQMHSVQSDQPKPELEKRELVERPTLLSTIPTPSAEAPSAEAPSATDAPAATSEAPNVKIPALAPVAQVPKATTLDPAFSAEEPEEVSFPVPAAKPPKATFASESAVEAPPATIVPAPSRAASTAQREREEKVQQPSCCVVS